MTFGNHLLPENQDERQWTYGQCTQTVQAVLAGNRLLATKPLQDNCSRGIAASLARLPGLIGGFVSVETVQLARIHAPRVAPDALALLPVLCGLEVTVFFVAQPARR